MNETQSTNPTNNRQPRFQPNIFHLVIALSLIVGIIIVVISIIINHNEYPEIKISNFNKYYPSIPNDDKKSAQSMLYNIVSNNVTSDSMKIPKSGAKIREGTTNGIYDQATNIYTDRFVVDIESIQQSYFIQISWSPDLDAMESYTGYPIFIQCPTTEQLIYPAFNCTDGFNSQQETNFFANLPINVAYYTDNYASYVSYNISAKNSNVDDQQSIIVINDNTGGNYEAALAKLREANINPDDYKIEYNDLSEEQVPARAPDS